MKKDPQETWDDYYINLQARRASEAQTLWQGMAAAGVTEDTFLALDFLHFTPDADNADALAEQLKENYEMKIFPSTIPGYWNVEGTTRPEGILLTKENHVGWVKFMCKVAESHSCVFSTWTLEDPKTGKSWSNEND